MASEVAVGGCATGSGATPSSSRSQLTAEGGATLAQPGEGGLFRLLDGIRLRERDGGKRFLVDLRSGGARLFMEVRFRAEANPLSRWRLLKGLVCPTAL